MSRTLAPAVNTNRLSVLTGLPRSHVERLLQEMYARGLDVLTWPPDRALAGIQAYRAGHNADAVEMLQHIPFLRPESWLVSSDEDAHVFANLLQATAYIDSRPYVSYRLTPVGALLLGDTG